MKRMAGLLIGDVAKRTGVPATIRYYEDIGLLPAAARSGAGYRHYNASTVDELLFIRKAQALGFSLEEISEILRLSRSGREPCSHVLTLAHQHLAAVDERIRQLRVFRPACGGRGEVGQAEKGRDVHRVVPIHHGGETADGKGDATAEAEW